MNRDQMLRGALAREGEWDLLELVAEIPASKLPIPIRNK